VDLLDRLLEHDAWTTGQLLERCRDLSDEELDRRFEIGHRSVRATLHHIIFNMEVWAALMAGAETAEVTASRREQSVADLAVRLDRAVAELARVARGVRTRGGWDEQWIDILDNPPTAKTYGGSIAHVITHSMHHRAQLLYMLRQLGLHGLPEGDVLTWEQQRRSEPRMNTSHEATKHTKPSRA